MIDVFVVRRPTEFGFQVISAWVDEYDAKFEAERWSYDKKESWDYVRGTLSLEEANPNVDR